MGTTASVSRGTSARGIKRTRGAAQTNRTASSGRGTCGDLVEACKKAPAGPRLSRPTRPGATQSPSTASSASRCVSRLLDLERWVWNAINLVARIGFSLMRVPDPPADPAPGLRDSRQTRTRASTANCAHRWSRGRPHRLAARGHGVRPSAQRPQASRSLSHASFAERRERTAAAARCPGLRLPLLARAARAPSLCVGCLPLEASRPEGVSLFNAVCRSSANGRCASPTSTSSWHQRPLRHFHSTVSAQPLGDRLERHILAGRRAPNRPSPITGG